MIEDPSALEKEGLEQYKARRYAEALACFQQAQRLFASQGNARGVAEMWNGIGVVYYRQGRWAEAEEAFHQAQQTAAEVGDRLGEGKALGNLGSLYARRRKTAEAEASLTQAIAIFREIGDQEKLQDSLKALSDLKLKHGRWVEALYHYETELESNAQPRLWQRFQRRAIRLLKNLLRLP